MDRQKFAQGKSGKLGSVLLLSVKDAAHFIWFTGQVYTRHTVLLSPEGDKEKGRAREGKRKVGRVQECANWLYQ